MNILNIIVVNIFFIKKTYILLSVMQTGFFPVLVIPETKPKTGIYFYKTAVGLGFIFINKHDMCFIKY